MSINIEKIKAMAEAATPSLGNWKADDSSEGRVFLLWTCEESEWPSDYCGDEAWSRHGGDEIVAAIGEEPDDSGIDRYTDKHGNDIACHWVMWEI